MRKIGIIVNPEKDPGLQYLNQTVKVLTEAGFTPAVSCCNYDTKESYSFVTPEECFADAELVLTLGGDGTLLRAAPYAQQYQVPVLGINLGHLGFLAELEPSEISALPSIINGGFVCSDRMLLSVGVIRNSCCIAETVALNDAVIRSGNGKPAQIVLSDMESDLLEYFCDGFIVATPTGSTAYSMSAGGPILEPCSNAIVVTPICPHTLGARSVVFGDISRTLYLRVSNTDRIHAILECDGAEITALHSNDVVQISRHSDPIRLVKLHNKSFYKVLNDKISRRMS